jgi:hypothetical protein
MRIPECLLHRVQVRPIGKAFDRCDLRAIGLRREKKARADRLAVEKYRAGPACTVLAPGMGASKLELITNEIQKQKA